MTSTRQAIACIFAVFGIAVVANAQVTTAKEPSSTITGKVTVKGKGVSGVFVVLREGERRVMSGREYSGPKGVTDDEGNYRIVNVPPGSYRILPVAKAFIPAGDTDRERLLIVNKSETIEHIDFTLLPGGVITGKVVDAQGWPIVEEPVYVLTVPDNGNVYQPSNSSTDDRGVYRIYGLKPGSYRVAAGRGEESFQTGLPRPYKRTYHPSVNDPSQATVVEVTEGSEIKDVDITFSGTVSTYFASGRVVDGETGQPLANINYGITRYEEKGTSSMGGGYVTNSRGEFKLENLSPGKYSVPISRTADSDLRFEEVKFEIVDQNVTDLVIKATKGSSISGVVVFEGLDEKAMREPVGRSWLMASIDRDAGRSNGASAQIAPDGSFHIRGLGSGTATFYLYSNGNIHIDRVERDGIIQTQNSVVLREREHINGVRVVAQYGNASLRGKIEVENGTLPPDARFSVWARRLGDDQTTMYPGSNARPQVDGRGQFVIEGLTAGTYEIDASVFLTSSKIGFAAKRQQVVITAGSTINVILTVDLSSTPIKQ